MPQERYYTTETLALHLQIKLEEGEFHHLIHVMRASLGQTIELVDGKGLLAEATIIQIDKKKALLEVSSLKKFEADASEIILIQAIPRLHRLDSIIEKATELGVNAIWLFPGERSERKSLTEKQVEKLELISIAAMKQCGRFYLPAIKLLPPIEKWKPFQDCLYYGSVAPEAPLLLSIYKVKANEKAYFCIGPESGFSEKEEIQLHALEAKGVKLHPNILRTDTAAITILALATHDLPPPLCTQSFSQDLE